MFDPQAPATPFRPTNVAPSVHSHPSDLDEALTAGRIRDVVRGVLEKAEVLARKASRFARTTLQWGYDNGLFQAENADAIVTIGNILSDAEKDGDAVEIHKLALALDERHVIAHHQLGRSYGKLGLFKDAEREYLRVLDIDPSFSLSVRPVLSVR